MSVAWGLLTVLAVVCNYGNDVPLSSSMCDTIVSGSEV